MGASGAQVVPMKLLFIIITLVFVKSTKINENESYCPQVDLVNSFIGTGVSHIVLISCDNVFFLCLTYLLIS